MGKLRVDCLDLMQVHNLGDGHASCGAPKPAGSRARPLPRRHPTIVQGHTMIWKRSSRETTAKFPPGTK